MLACVGRMKVHGAHIIFALSGHPTPYSMPSPAHIPLTIVRLMTRVTHASPPHTTAKAARGLRNVEILGLKQDPYLRLRAGGKVVQTRVMTDGGSMASWNERFQIPIPNVSERYV